MVITQSSKMSAPNRVREHAVRDALGTANYVLPALGIDSLYYLRSLENEQQRDLLRSRSVIDPLRTKINQVDEERGELAKLRQRLQLQDPGSLESEPPLPGRPNHAADASVVPLLPVPPYCLRRHLNGRRVIAPEWREEQPPAQHLPSTRRNHVTGRGSTSAVITFAGSARRSACSSA